LFGFSHGLFGFQEIFDSQNLIGFSLYNWFTIFQSQKSLWASF